MRILLTVLALLAFTSTANSQTTVTDARGHEVTIEDPSRIVALGGDVTEILFALEAGDLIVANDTTSIYPPQSDDLPKVGYVRGIAAEGLLSMSPTLVIANAEAGPPAALDQVESIGVPVVHLPDNEGVQSIAPKIRLIANAIGRPEDGDALADAVETRLAETVAADIDEAARVPVLFILNAASGAPMAAGEATAADEVIHASGGRNVFTGYEGYRPLSPEAAIAAAPDVVLMMQHSFEAMGGMEGLRAHPALGVTPAVRNGHVIAIDGLLLLGFGPRTPDAIAEVRDGLAATRETN